VTSGSVVPVPGKATSPTITGGPRSLTLSGLKSFVRQVGHPVYWVGPRPGTTYELTQTTQGRIFVRYLPAGASVGTSTPFVTVGTYPVPRALGDTRRLAATAGSVQISVSGGAVAFYARSRPTNVYEAFPGVDYQLEVYDPSASEGHQLVASGRVAPIG
jgi:hypothetical protein